MARPYTCYSSCRNPLPAVEDELANAAPTEGSSTSTPSPAVSCTSTPIPTIALSSDNKLFKQFMKAYLEA